MVPPFTQASIKSMRTHIPFQTQFPERSIWQQLKRNWYGIVNSRPLLSHPSSHHNTIHTLQSRSTLSHITTRPFIRRRFHQVSQWWIQQMIVSRKRVLFKLIVASSGKSPQISVSLMTTPLCWESGIAPITWTKWSPNSADGPTLSAGLTAVMTMMLFFSKWNQTWDSMSPDSILQQTRDLTTIKLLTSFRSKCTTAKTTVRMISTLLWTWPTKTSIENQRTLILKRVLRQIWAWMMTKLCESNRSLHVLTHYSLKIEIFKLFKVNVMPKNYEHNKEDRSLYELSKFISITVTFCIFIF